MNTRTQPRKRYNVWPSEAHMEALRVALAAVGVGVPFRPVDTPGLRDIGGQKRGNRMSVWHARGWVARTGVPSMLQLTAAAAADLERYDATPPEKRRRAGFKPADVVAAAPAPPGTLPRLKRLDKVAGRRDAGGADRNPEEVRPCPCTAPFLPGRLMTAFDHDYLTRVRSIRPYRTEVRPSPLEA